MLYECPGDIPMNPQLLQLQAEGFPKEITSIIGKHIKTDAATEYWKSAHNGYNTSILPKAVLIKDPDNYKKLITELSSVVDGIKLIDILALKYGIYSFNDNQTHLNSYFSKNSGYVDCDTSMYTVIIMISVNNKKYTFGINYHRFWSERTRKSTNDKWFGRDKLPVMVSSMFDDERLVGNTIIIDEFVKMCRNNIKK